MALVTFNIIIFKQDQVNNADSVIVFLINYWSVRIVKVVILVRVVELVQDVRIVQVVQVVQVVKVVQIAKVVSRGVAYRVPVGQGVGL